MRSGAGSAVLSAVLQAWQNEKCAPDILHYASDLIPILVEQIRAQASPNSPAPAMDTLQKHAHGRFSKLSWRMTASPSICKQCFSLCSSHTVVSIRVHPVPACSGGGSCCRTPLKLMLKLGCMRCLPAAGKDDCHVAYQPLQHRLQLTVLRRAVAESCASPAAGGRPAAGATQPCHTSACLC